MNPPEVDPLILPLASPDATLERVGGKGASLARMAAAGLPVPAGFHITTQAYRRFVDESYLAEVILAAAAQADPGDPASLERASARIRALFDQGGVPADIAAEILRHYAELGLGGPPVAVRSSATAEDLPELSFAGQQETYLNVRGGEALLAAVKRCWASLWTARAIGYRARQGIAPDEVALAVVVQALVPAEAAGVLFTANPLTGAPGEIVINAAWGLGEAVVGGLVTPDTLVVDKETGTVLSQTVADKAVMTVRLPEGTREEPVPDDRRHAAVLSSDEAVELAQLGATIEALYERPMDVEWTLEGGRFGIVQARPITALPEPRVVLDWERLPAGPGMYARASVIELLPDPLSPLFSSLALPYWNAGMRDLMRELGLERVISEYRLVTVNDFAYYHYTFTAREMAQIIFHMIAFSRRLGNWFRRAEARWAEEARPRYAAVTATWGARDLPALPAAELLAGVREITQAAANHYLAIQSGILPAAYMSEGLFTGIYQRLLQRRGDPPALSFMLGFDSTPIQAEKSLFDLAAWARTQPELAEDLARGSGVEIAAAWASAVDRVDGVAPVDHANHGDHGDPVDAWGEFRQRFSAHLDRFGHAVYDLDFAKSVPADDPAPLVETLKYFLGGQAPSPYERQAAAAAAREEATRRFLARSGPGRRLAAPLLAWAQRFSPLREDGLADVGLGWPVLRRMLREIGRRLVAAGVLAEADDVFWLTADEIEAATRALDAGQAGEWMAGVDCQAAVAERRARWEHERRATPPVALPEKVGARWMGIDFSRFMPARSEQAEGDRLHGIGASPGRVTGRACVMHGPEDFGAMRPGDILVAKITTPAWTPLFALAAGIVTDVGGPLSHSSIVAREYRIPAVLGTGAATARIKSGQRVTVDGDGGVVTLLD